ncbi:hypothetical protein BaRGS_00001805 [Batillaria attramentaria]|uniref:Uncharacterized protein n=1 Tax=Batillaria attramentaria TaxID=370345 RepID=A0ABD0M536_9CAEN
MAEKQDNKGLSNAQQKQLGEERETWCSVERMKEQTWCRKTRRHYDTHLESHLFEEGAGFTYEPRCTFQVNAPTHRERRHFNRRHREFHTYSSTCTVRCKTVLTCESQDGGKFVVMEC